MVYGLLALLNKLTNKEG